MNIAFSAITYEFGCYQNCYGLLSAELFHINYWRQLTSPAFRGSRFFDIIDTK